MKTLARIGISLLLGAALLGAAVSVQAEERCEQTYGGGEVCRKSEVLIDKFVKEPNEDVWVDNLGVDDPHFKAGDEVVFRLRIKNVSSFWLEDVEVRDRLPAYLDYISGPGSWDSASREVRFTVEDLRPNDPRDFEIKARVVNRDSLPQDKTLVCVVNEAEVWDNDDSYDRDTAQLCIERGEVVVEKAPEAGPEHGVMIALGSLVLGVLGLKLYRKGRIAI